MSTLSLGLVGVGKIARAQHLPALSAAPDCQLAATADPHASLPGVPAFESLEAMLDHRPEIQAVAICTPTHLRFATARLAIARGRHVLLEKPPGATLSEVEELIALARKQGVTLFTAWHSRFAPGVAAAAEWLAKRTVKHVEIVWKEDVRVWHPGQTWIWQPGGMGVFDPGINALSIATRILPDAFFLREATLQVPSNCQTPIAAELFFVDTRDATIKAQFDFRQTGPQTWDIHVETDAGRLALTRGGACLTVDGETLVDTEEREYAELYAHFAALVRRGQSDVDVSPLRHTADAFLYGHRQTVEPFIDG